MAALGTFAFFLLYYICSLSPSQAAKDGPVLRSLGAAKQLGTSPFWDTLDNVLYYVDSFSQTLYRYDPATGSEKSISFNDEVSLVVPIKENKNRFLVTVGLDMLILNWDWTSGYNSTSVHVSVEQNRAFNVWGAGKADAKGRIWAGTRSGKEISEKVSKNKGTLFRVDNNPMIPCRTDLVLAQVSRGGGMAWSHDNKVFYYIDSPTRKVDSFSFNLRLGEISNRKTVFEFGDIPGNPDGMTIDVNGNLWIACNNGSRVIQLNPSTGKILRMIKLPVQSVTSLTFGGKKLDTLYVTTSRVSVDPAQLMQQPLAGSLFEITNLKVTGVPGERADVSCKCLLSRSKFGDLLVDNKGTPPKPGEIPLHYLNKIPYALLV